MAWMESVAKKLERERRLRMEYPEFEYATPDKVMQVDNYRVRNGGFPSKFSQTAMRLAKYAVELGEQAQAGAPPEVQEAADWETYRQRRASDGPVPGVPRGVAEAFPETAPQGTRVYESGSSAPSINIGGSLVDNRNGLPGPLNAALDVPVLGRAITEAARPANWIAAAIAPLSFAPRAGLATRLAGEVASATAGAIAGQFTAEHTEGLPAPVRTGLSLGAGIGAGLLAGGAVTRPQATLGAVGRGATTYRDLTKGIPVGASVRDVGGMVDDAIPTDPAAKLTALIKAAKPARGQTEALKSAEMSRRVSRVAGALESGSGESAFFRAKGQLGGQLPKAQFDAPRVGLTQADITGLFDRIRTSNTIRPLEKINTADALTTALAGQIPTRGQLKQLENVFGSEMVDALLSKRSFGAKAWENLLDAMNIPRSLMTSIDLSAPFRQGIMLAPGHPRQFIAGFAPMVRSFASESYARGVDDSIRRSPYAEIKEAAGLYFAPLGRASALSEHEEAFMSKIVQRVPGIRGSQRAYTTFLNKLRSDVFDNWWARLGADDQTPDNAHRFAAFVNAASGRGNISALGNIGPALNSVLFSPRYFVSRFETAGRGVGAVTDLARTSAMLQGPNPVSKEIAKDMIAFFGTGIAALTLVKETGLGDVELNPRSADFGKIQVGPVRYDVWAGNVQIARFISQMVTGERKSTITDETNTVERGSILEGFIRSKLAPSVGVGVDFARGESMIGDKIDLSPGTIQDQFYRHLTPLVIQELIDGYHQEGHAGVLKALPAFVGVGVQSYGISDVDKAAQEQFEGRAFRDLLPAEKDKFRTDNPELAKQMDEEAIDRGGTSARAVEIRQDIDERQRADDEILAADPGYVTTWRENTNDRQKELFLRKDELYQDVDFGKGRFPILDEYFKQIDAATQPNGTVDWDKVDAWRGSLDPEDDKFIDDHTGLGGTPKVREYRNDRRAITKSGYWEIRDTVFDYFLEAQRMAQGRWKFDDYWAEVRKQYRAYAIDFLDKQNPNWRQTSPQADVLLANAEADRLRGKFDRGLSESRKAWLAEHMDTYELLVKWGYRQPGVEESMNYAGVGQ